MKILMVHPHDIYSGLEPWTVRIVSIAREFVKKGHEVKLVYFPLSQDNQKPQESKEGFAAIPFNRNLGPHILISNILRLCRIAGWADIVHLQKCFYHAAMPAIIACLLRRKPMHYDWDDWELKIYEVSTQPCPLRDFIRHFLSLLENTIPQLADTVSVASARLRRECLKLGVDENRIFESHVGADIKRFNPGVSGQGVRQRYNIKNPLILYLGQLHGGQYVELFLEAASILANDYKKDFSFMIVGDGYRAGELKKFARKLNLDGKVIFTGAVSHDAVPEYISAAEVCVACFEENEVTSCKSPLKIVEYLASGKAIVASNVGEVQNMVGEAGILTPPGDAGALSRGIIRVVEDGNMRDSLGRLARQRAEEKYNWAVTARNLLEAYAMALKTNNAKHQINS